MLQVEAVQAVYKDSLVIPKEKPQRQCIIAPVGLIGAGKTTVVKPVAEALGVVRVSTDEYRILLKENGHGYETVKSFIRNTCKELLEAGHSIALDANCGGQTAFTFIQKAKELFGVKVYWLNIDTPETYAIEGLLKRASPMVEDNEEWLRNRANQKERMEHLGYEFDFFWRFDISQPDLSTEIEACIAKLRTEIF